MVVAARVVAAAFFVVVVARGVVVEVLALVEILLPDVLGAEVDVCERLRRVVETVVLVTGAAV